MLRAGPCRCDGCGEKDHRVDQREKPPHILGTAANEQRAFFWTGQKRADTILSPNPIFSLTWCQRIRGVGADPFGPFGRIEIVGPIAPCRQLMRHRGFTRSGHARNQRALHARPRLTLIGNRSSSARPEIIRYPGVGAEVLQRGFRDKPNGHAPPTARNPGDAGGLPIGAGAGILTAMDTHLHRLVGTRISGRASPGRPDPVVRAVTLAMEPVCHDDRTFPIFFPAFRR